MELRSTFTRYKRKVAMALAEGRKGWNMAEDYNGVDASKLSPEEKSYYQAYLKGQLDPQGLRADSKEMQDSPHFAAQQQAVKDALAKLHENDEPEKEPVPEHKHQWRRGMLPGSVYLKTCMFPGCGVTEKIKQDEWMVLA